MSFPAKYPGTCRRCGDQPIEVGEMIEEYFAGTALQYAHADCPNPLTGPWLDGMSAEQLRELEQSDPGSTGFTAEQIAEVEN